jgi:hypothetical protein
MRDGIDPGPQRRQRRLRRSLVFLGHLDTELSTQKGDGDQIIKER